MNDRTSALTQIDHVAINVADVEKAAQWYRSSFGCEIIAIDKTVAILRFRNLNLHLILPGQEPGHLSFVREDVSKFGELRQRTDGSLSTYLSDPSGNFVEIVGSTTTSLNLGEAELCGDGASDDNFVLAEN